MKKVVLGMILALALSVPAQAAESAQTWTATDADLWGTDTAADLAAWAALDAAPVDEAVFAQEAVPATAAGLEVSAPSAILMERETGTVIWEKNADERLEPASVTKVMTMLLLAEAVDSGSVALTDTAVCSAYAASMGGSQVFLEENERMTLADLLKSVAVSSGNDAAVVIAEHLCGSESAFVARMNERAGELGMTGTVFQNCTGLPCEGEHLTTARDIAIMSRELLGHTWIREYTTIWTDTIRGGEFGLSNTNKLIRFYDGATGLKTGFTQTAGYCLSASAFREDVEYIAVVLNCDTSQDRFESAKQLLSFAFANYTLVNAVPREPIPPVNVTLGQENTVQPGVPERFNVLMTRNQASLVQTEVVLPESVEAPVTEGQELGEMTVTAGETTIARIPLKAACGVERLTLWQIWGRLLRGCFAGAI